MTDPWAHPYAWLASVDAGLNLVATGLLVVGLRQIRAGRVDAHRRTMWAAFAVSVAFLACYLVYHSKVGSVPFRGTGFIRKVYLAVLIPHVILAALVPFMALRTLYLGEKDRRAAHRWWARLTWPTWFFVSVSGVVVYLFVYWY